jgi:hypothetical protein
MSISGEIPIRISDAELRRRRSLVRAERTIAVICDNCLIGQMDREPAFTGPERGFSNSADRPL